MGCCVSTPLMQPGPDAPLSRQNLFGDVRNAPSSLPSVPGGAGADSARTAHVAAAPAGDTHTGPAFAAPQPNGVHATPQRGASASPSVGVKSDIKPQNRFEIQPGAPLGKGHFAVVKKARDSVTGKMCAVKIIEKKEMVKSTASVVKQEIEILKAVGAHPNVVQLIDHWEDSTRHFLVLELCEGGDLFSQIVEHGKYSETDAVRCCRQLADALKHIHSCGITHRDLKPENILLISPSPTSLLKIADFGLSKLIKGHLHPMRTVCGTWAYCVAADTRLRCIDSRGKRSSVRARDVKPSSSLIDEFDRPVSVKAIHTTAASVAPLWRVMHAETGALLFRCTSDHKLSFLSQQPQRRRIEIRCSDFAEMSSEEQSTLLAYTAADESKQQTFRIRVEAPALSAPREQYVGIEVASDTHRFQLAASDEENSSSLTFGLVTSNCAPEVIQRRPYDSSVDNWTLGVLMYILLSGYHPFDVYGECFTKGTKMAGADGTDIQVENIKRGQQLVGEDGRVVEVEADAKPVRAAGGVYTIEHPNSSYNVTAKHLLTLCVNHGPRLSVRRSSRFSSGYEAAITFLDSSMHGFRSEIFEAEPSDFPSETEEEQQQFAEFKQTQIDQIIAAGEREMDSRPAGQLGAGVASSPAAQQFESSKPVLRGTVAEILSSLRSQLDSLPLGSFLVSGQLIEMRAEDISQRWQSLQMDSTKTAALSGRRVPLPSRSTKEHSVEQEGIISYSHTTNAQPRVAYQLFQDAHEQHSLPGSSLLHLEPLQSLLRVNTQEQGVFLSELRVSSSCLIAPDASEYEQRCSQEIEAVLNSSVESVIAFGAHTRSQWLRTVAQMQLAYSSLNLQHGVTAIDVLHPCRSLPLRVFFSPYLPSSWRHSRSLATVLALAHGLDVNESRSIAPQLERIPLRSITHLPGPTTVYNVAIAGKSQCSKRFALADSASLTHNCPEPELLSKIMACEYDFDDPVWHNVSAEAKGLIRGLLVLDPAKRLSVDAYLASPWISRGQGAAQTQNPLVLERLSKFGVGNKFRALVVAKMASNKFKASISRSKKAGAGKQGGGGNVGLLADGTLDYLGLGSERNVQSSPRAGTAGLESVRETHLAAAANGADGQHLKTPSGNHNNQFEPSASSSSRANNSKGVLSVNQLDLISRRGGGGGADRDALGMDGVLMLHGGGGTTPIPSQHGDGTDTDGETGTPPIPRSSRTNSVGGGATNAGGTASAAASPANGGSRAIHMSTIHTETSGASSSSRVGGGGLTIAAGASVSSGANGVSSPDRKGGLTGHRSHSGLPVNTRTNDSTPTPP